MWLSNRFDIKKVHKIIYEQSSNSNIIYSKQYIWWVKRINKSLKCIQEDSKRGQREII
jgi:hypothetical protein